MKKTHLNKESHFYYKTCNYPNNEAQNSIGHSRRTNVNINLDKENKATLSHSYASNIVFKYIRSKEI